MKERDDRIALLETKNEEIKTQLDEKEFEVQVRLFLKNK